MLSQKITFKGLNEDSDERALGPGNYKLPTLNIWVWSNRQEVFTNIQGTTLVVHGMPGGDNKCIGAYEDKASDFIYYFVWNGSGYNTVLRFTKTSRTIDLLLLDDPGQPFLFFQRNKKITGIRTYHADERNTLLIWTDDNSEVKKINVQKALNCFPSNPSYNSSAPAYSLPITSVIVDLIKHPPLKPPVCQFFNDTSSTTGSTDPTYVNNYLKKHIFQFRYSWVYDDFEESTLGVISPLIYAGEQNNTITVQVEAGGQTVNKIRIYARLGNTGDFYLIDTLIKSELSIPDNSTTVYNFRNDKTYSAISTAQADLLYSFIPKQANALDFIDSDRLTIGNGVEGFNNVNMRTSRAQPAYLSPPLLTSLSSYPLNTNIAKGLKNVGTYHFGVIYFDAGGRISTTNTSAALKINTFSEFNGGPKTVEQVLVTIDNLVRPPEDAVKWALVRTKNAYYARYIQFVANKVTFIDATGSTVPFANCTQLKIDFSNIQAWSLANNSNLVYSFAEGDRIRLVNKAAGNSLAQNLDYQIVKQDGDGNVFINSSSSLRAYEEFLAPGDLFELYSPGTVSSEDFYYEVAAVYPIISPGSNSVHGGDTNQVFGTTDATVTFPTFDTYFRVREMPTTIGPVRQIIQSPSISDFFISEASDIGRPNKVDKDARRIRRPTTIWYTEPYVADTSINGLNIVYDTNFERYSDYGSIQKLFYHNKRLKVFQENKVGELFINERVVYDNNNQSTLAASQNVLNNMMYYSGEYGISRNPESFAVFGNAIYFTDVKRGAVCRLSNDGIVPISNYGMTTHFLNKFATLKGQDQSGNLFVYGTYHRDHREYVIAIVDETDLSQSPNSETIAFNEDENLWTTQYSFVPDFMSSDVTGLVSFKNGRLWIHDDSQDYNTFYGVKYPSKVTVVCNTAPSNDKAFLITTLEGTSAWDVDITTASGQVSQLKTFDFENVGTEWRAAYLCDMNSPDGLLNGDQLLSVWLKQTLTNNDSGPVKLYCANVGFVNSDFLFK